MAIFAQLMGSAFRPKEVREYLLTLPLGTRLTLVREPDNKFDSNAIQVFEQDILIGLIDRQAASELASRMDDGEKFIAKIKRADDPKKPLLEIFPDD